MHEQRVDYYSSVYGTTRKHLKVCPAINFEEVRSAILTKESHHLLYEERLEKLGSRRLNPGRVARFCCIPIRRLHHLYTKVYKSGSPEPGFNQLEPGFS